VSEAALELPTRAMDRLRYGAMRDIREGARTLNLAIDVRHLRDLDGIPAVLHCSLKHCTDIFWGHLGLDVVHGT